MSILFGMVSAHTSSTQSMLSTICSRSASGITGATPLGWMAISSETTPAMRWSQRAAALRKVVQVTDVEQVVEAWGVPDPAGPLDPSCHGVRSLPAVVTARQQLFRSRRRRRCVALSLGFRPCSASVTNRGTIDSRNSGQVVYPMSTDRVAYTSDLDDPRPGYAGRVPGLFVTESD